MALLNIKDGRSDHIVIYNIVAAVLMAVLGLLQYICEKQKKDKLLKYIYAAAIAAEIEKL